MRGGPEEAATCVISCKERLLSLGQLSPTQTPLANPNRARDNTSAWGGAKALRLAASGHSSGPMELLGTPDVAELAALGEFWLMAYTAIVVAAFAAFAAAAAKAAAPATADEPSIRRPGGEGKYEPCLRVRRRRGQHWRRGNESQKPGANSSHCVLLQWGCDGADECGAEAGGCEQKQPW